MSDDGFFVSEFDFWLLEEADPFEPLFIILKDFFIFFLFGYGLKDIKSLLYELWNIEAESRFFLINIGTVYLATKSSEDLIKLLKKNYNLNSDYDTK